jgi:phospholipase C
LALAGSAGFGDKQAVQFENGQTILFQPDATRSDGGFLLPTP